MIKVRFTEEYDKQDYIEVKGNAPVVALDFYHLLIALRKAMGADLFDASLIGYITSNEECFRRVKEQLNSDEADIHVEMSKTLDELSELLNKAMAKRNKE